MAAESDVRKMPTVVITGPPRSIAKKKKPLQKKEASLLTFSITKLIKVLVSLSKFTERQLLVIKTRNKPDKKVHITLSRHFVFGKGPGRPELDLNFCLVSRSPKVNSEPLIYIFHQVHRHGSYNFRQTNFKDFSSLFQRQITVSRTKIFFNPLLNTLLAKTHHGVIYYFNFFSHGWPHYFILLSAENLSKWLVEKAIKSVKTNFIQTSWCTEKYWDKGIVVWRATCVSEFWPMVTCRNWLNKLIDTSPSGKK